MPLVTGNFSKDKNIIHIDIDPEEIGSNFTTLVGLVGDAKETLKTLHKLIEEYRPEKTWIEYISKLKEQKLKNIKAYSNQFSGNKIRPQIVLANLNEIASEEDVLESDASSSSGWTAKYFLLKRGGRVYMAPRGFAGLRYGLPAAIGAYASGMIKGRAIVVAGNGGFSYTVSELETLKRVGYPIMVIILNDSALGWIKLEQELFQDEKVISSTFLNTEYAKITESYGIKGYRIEHPQHLGEVLRKAYSLREPVVVDIATITDPMFSLSLYETLKKKSSLLLMNYIKY
jgi:acetolactate synthase-1/2/3 large subunit